MARVLVLTTDLPYFPGKMGVDFFNLRHLASSHEIAVVAPSYEWFPQEGVSNLEKLLNCSFVWPKPVAAVPLFVPEDVSGWLPSWLARSPVFFRRLLLDRILHIHNAPQDAYEKLAILANCAPYLLQAHNFSHWHTIVLIQTSTAPWLDYLPATGGKFVYFHDVRSDYLKRATALPGQPRLPPSEIAAIARQEQKVATHADVVGFVSALDLERAQQQFVIRAESGVAPIPVDTVYYHPAPAGWARDGRPIVLFTGHLSHPPNVDAILHFLAEIWPRILAAIPAAVFQAVGMLPSPEVERAMHSASRCELHANVPDIRPYFWNASVYIVPMRFGGGVRQKIFESWSMRVPVVCTTMAAEGTGARSGHECWLEDEPAEFAARVVSLIKEQEPDIITGPAQARVEARNSITAAAPQFQALVERAFHIKKHRPFKLLYDLRWMELGKAGGVEQATYELLSAISRYDHNNQYRIYAPRSACCEWNFPRGFRYAHHFSDQVEKGIEAQHAFLANRLAETLGKPAVLTPAMRSLAAYKKIDFDLVHSVVSYTHPDLQAFPGILTINDLQHLHHPQFFTQHEIQEREKLYRESARRAKHIICISEYTKQDVHHQYGVPLEKMSTVWIIPSRNVWQQIHPPMASALLQGMGIDSPFIFYPAHCWPHKNHARLVEAFRLIAPSLPANIKLILTGRPFAPAHPAAILIRELNLEKRVVHLGYRSPLEVRALFQHCLLVVFPSLFEGFGMPVAEAIIAGKPVACSNLTSLPEIGGPAALTFDPTNIHDIGKRILEIVNDPARQADLTAAALRQRTSFSARASAVKTLAVYQRVYDELYRT